MPPRSTGELLRVISPCEHGIKHHIISVLMGATLFSVPECVDGKGRPRIHVITEGKYPADTERLN